MHLSDSPNSPWFRLLSGNQQRESHTVLIDDSSHFLQFESFFTDYALNLLRENNLSQMYQFFAFYALENSAVKTRGHLLTKDELALFMEINRTVISCTLNGRPCELEFDFNRYLRCYNLKTPEVPGNILPIVFLSILHRLITNICSLFINHCYRNMTLV